VIFFDWDPHKERANRRKHSEHEIRELIIGHSSAGRLLIVSFIELLPEQVRIISAREATRREQRDYEEAV